MGGFNQKPPLCGCLLIFSAITELHGWSRLLGWSSGTATGSTTLLKLIFFFFPEISTLSHSKKCLFKCHFSHPLRTECAKFCLSVEIDARICEVVRFSWYFGWLPAKRGAEPVLWRKTTCPLMGTRSPIRRFTSRGRRSCSPARASRRQVGAFRCRLRPGCRYQQC